MRRLLTLLVAVGMLAGCDARATTSIAVRGDRVGITAVVDLDGEAATAASSSAAETSIRDTFVAQAGVPPNSVRRTASKGHVRYQADLTYAQLTAARGVLGVESAAFTRTGSGGQLLVKLVRPQKLIEAIRSSVATKPDADAAAEAILGTVEIAVSVTFAGRVTRSGFSPAPRESAADGTLDSSPSGVLFAQSLSRFSEGTLEVDGDPDPSPSRPWLPLAAGLLAVAGVIAWAARIDQRKSAARRLNAARRR